MDRRTHEGPMDFEYNNGTGPIDARSPFAQLSGNQQPFASMGMGMDSPGKRNGGRHAFPHSPTKSLNSFRGIPPFSTPGKFDHNEAASSGGETPQSPSQDITMLDSDATPDQSMNFRGVAARFDPATKPTFPPPSPTKLKDKKMDKVRAEEKRRDSWWSRAAGLMSISPTTNSSPNSSGRGEASIAEQKATKTVGKKKREGTMKQLMRSRKESVSESEESRPPSPSKSRRRLGWLDSRGGRKNSDDSATSVKDGKTEAGKARRAWWWGVAEFLTQHPTLPQILSWYAQLLLNGFLILGLMYILYSFYATIRNDIDRRSSETVSELLAEMAVCAKSYTDNRCQPESRVPAMETVCQNWEKCMRQDPHALGRARISVGMWAEIFNGFVEPISWKTVMFTVIIIFGAVTLSNLPFSMIRHHAERQQAANHHHYYGNVPPTPAAVRQFSNPDYNWTPHHQNQQHQDYGLEPAPSAGVGRVDGRGSPVRRLQFR